MNKQEILKHLEELTKKVNALENESPDFEVGKWYTNGRSMLLLTSKYKRGVCGVGIGGRGNWTNNWYAEPDTDNLRLATEEEIKTALIKEAEKRGFKGGVKFNQVNGIGCGYDSKGLCFIPNDYKYSFSEDKLYNCGMIIYRKGQWAEIIKEEPLKVADHEVVYHPLAKQISVNATLYTYAEMKSLAQMMAYGQIKSLNVGCSGQYKVTKEDIEKIIKGFEN